MTTIQRLTIFQDDDVTPILGTVDISGNVVEPTCSTDAAAARPYLQRVLEMAESEVDFVKGTSTIGQCSVTILDKRTVATDQTTGWFTQILANAGGNNQIVGRRCLLEQQGPDGTFYVVMHGIVGDITLNDSLVEYTLEVKDMREREKNITLFDKSDGSLSLFPMGMADGYGTIYLPGQWLIPPIKGVKATFKMDVSGKCGIATVTDMNGNQKPDFDSIDKIMGASMAQQAYDSDGNPTDNLSYPWVGIRWRPWGSTGAYTLLTNMPVVGFNGLSTGFGYALQYGTISLPPIFKVHEFVGSIIMVLSTTDGVGLPTDGQAIEILMTYYGPPTDDFPLFIEKSFGQLLKDAYDGHYSTTVPRIWYNQAAVDAMVTNTPLARAKITGVEDDMFSWVEDNIYHPLGYAPSINSQGLITPLQYTLPDVTADLPVLDDSNVTGASWTHSYADVINKVTFTYIREVASPTDSSTPTGTWINRLISEDDVLVVDVTESASLIGEIPEDYTPVTVRALTNSGANQPLTGNIMDETGAQLARARAKDLFNRFSWGAQRMSIKALRSDTAVAALQNGDWVTVGVSYLPDYVTGKRGISRIAQIVKTQDLSPIERAFELIDGGPDVVPLSTPTIAAPTYTGSRVSVAISAIPAGAGARVEYAVSPTQPSANSGAWVFAGVVFPGPTGTILTPVVPNDTTVWVRARSEGVAMRPSAWTIAQSVATPSIPVIRNAIIKIVDGSNPVVSWTPDSAAFGYRVYWQTYAEGAVPASSFTLFVDVNGAAGSVTLPATMTLLQYDNILVRIVPYTGWTGTAVTGTAEKDILLKGKRLSGTYVHPSVQEAQSQAGTTGTLALTVFDPQYRLAQLEFQTQAGQAGAWSAWAVKASPYTKTVPLISNDVSSIAYRLTVIDDTGTRHVTGGTQSKFTLAVAAVECRARIVSSTATTVTVQVDAVSPTGVTPTVALISTSGSATVATRPVADGVFTTSGSQWVFNRGAFNSAGASAGVGEAQFRAQITGLQTDDDEVVIPDQGTDTRSLDVTAHVSAQTATQTTVTVSVNDPIPQGTNYITLKALVIDGVTMTQGGVNVTTASTFTLSSGGSLDFVIARPDFGAGNGGVKWQATAANRVGDFDSVLIPEKLRDSIPMKIEMQKLSYDGTGGKYNLSFRWYIPDPVTGDYSEATFRLSLQYAMTWAITDMATGSAATGVAISDWSAANGYTLSWTSTSSQAWSVHLSGDLITRDRSGSISSLAVAATLNLVTPKFATSTVSDPVVESGSYLDPTWLTGLAFSKITSTPTTIAGYGITDAPTKTGGGASGTWGISITGSAATAGTVTTAAQPAITSLGTLSSLTSSGTITGINFVAQGNVNPYIKLFDGTRTSFMQIVSGDLQLVHGGTAWLTFNNVTGATFPVNPQFGPNSNNPDKGRWNALYAAIAAGRPLFYDEEFATGTNGVVKYNNGTSPLSVVRTADATAPNITGQTLVVSWDGTGTTTPGLGGFLLNFNGAVNRTFVQRFIAKIPVGYTVNIAENSQGTGATSYWLTSQAGTGKWEEYIRVDHCGNGGTITGSGHVYLTGPAGAWSITLAMVNVYEVQTSGILGVLGSATSLNSAITGSSLTSLGTLTSLTVNGVTNLGGGSVFVNGGTLQVGSNTATQSLWMNGPAASNRQLWFRTAGSPRWNIYANNTAESGADAGSNLAIAPYTDGGVFIDNAITIIRAAGGAITVTRPINANSNLTVTGFTALNGGATVSGGSLTVGTNTTAQALIINGPAGSSRTLAFRSGNLSRWLVFTDASTESGSNIGSTFCINAYSDAGVQIDTPMYIVRAAGGAITFTRPVVGATIDLGTVTGVPAALLRVGGDIRSTGVAYAGDFTLVDGTGSTGSGGGPIAVQWNGSAVVSNLGTLNLTGGGVTNVTAAGGLVTVTISGAVASVFGRTGAVVAATGDYSFSQLSGIPTTLAGYGITDAPTKTGTGASGTWGISISGTAAAATTATTASSAAQLTTARTINGVSFNGTANITVAAAAGTLTGTALAAGVVSSSLTSVGTLSSLAVSGTASAGSFFATGASAVLKFADQGNAAHTFQWYSVVDTARLYSSGFGDIIQANYTTGIVTLPAGLVVGNGVTDLNATPIIEGIAGSAGNDSHWGRNVATFYNGSAATGAIVIKTSIPTTVDHMCRIQVVGYEYDATAPFELTIGSYLYHLGSFPNRGYISVGNKQWQVRVAFTPDGFYCFILDDIADAHPYLHLHVADVLIGYSASITSAMFDGWSISLVTDLSTYTNVTTVSNLTTVNWSSIVGEPTTIAGYGITDAPTKTGTGASGTWGIAITGNAASATKLQFARTINNVSFDGQSNITITIAGSALTGTSLASGIVTSSLTSVGTLTSLTVSGALNANNGITIPNGKQVVLNRNTGGVPIDALAYEVGTDNFYMRMGGSNFYIKNTGAPGADVVLIVSSTGVLTTAGTIACQGSGGFTIGGTSNVQRLTYGNDAADSFTFLTAGNAYANLYLGVLTTASTININTSSASIGYLIGGISRLTGDTSYTYLRDGSGRIAFYIGNTDPANYYDNDNHVFRSRTSVQFVSINSAGVQISGSSNALTLYDRVSTSQYFQTYASNSAWVFYSPYIGTVMSIDYTTGNINFRGRVDLNTSPFAQFNGTYNLIYEPDGGIGIYVGRTTTAPNLWFNGDNHYFRTRAEVLHTTINSGGITSHDFILG